MAFAAASRLAAAALVADAPDCEGKTAVGEDEAQMDPSNIVAVESFAPETVRAIVAQLENSTSADHMIYREAELDALWSQADIALKRARQRGETGVELDRLESHFRAAMEAHNLVADGRPAEAAVRLRQELFGGEFDH